MSNWEICNATQQPLLLDPNGWLNNFYIVFISFSKKNIFFFNLLSGTTLRSRHELHLCSPLRLCGGSLADPYCSPVVCQGWPCPGSPALLLLSRRPKTEILSKGRFESRPGASLLHHAVSGTSLIVLLLCRFCQWMQIFWGRRGERNSSLYSSVFLQVYGSTS